ncbi:MAG: hypothetical protein RL572_1650 [Pseudomonadota bacterium]|jgi:uncharacterized membrane-anchored protein YhcB (DUF1043 family)
MVWVIGFICLVVGAATGYLLAGRVSASPGRIAELETQLQEIQRSHSRYRDEVSEHFSTTADLVQQMTDSYRDVYQHLASGAQDLCSGEVARRMLPASSDGLLGGIVDEDDTPVQAPRDYAPKLSPDQNGALSEGFGLEKLRESDKDYL